MGSCLPVRHLVDDRAGWSTQYLGRVRGRPEGMVRAGRARTRTVRVDGGGRRPSPDMAGFTGRSILGSGRPAEVLTTTAESPPFLFRRPTSPTQCYEALRPSGRSGRLNRPVLRVRSPR